MTIGIPEVAARGNRILAEVERAIVGKRSLLQKILAAVLAPGVPGCSRRPPGLPYRRRLGSEVPVGLRALTGPRAGPGHGWSGAAFALLADLELRPASGGARFLIMALGELRWRFALSTVPGSPGKWWRHWTR